MTVCDRGRGQKLQNKVSFMDRIWFNKIIMLGIETNSMYSPTLEITVIPNVWQSPHPSPHPNL